jgi:hypothetical protein
MKPWLISPLTASRLPVFVVSLALSEDECGKTSFTTFAIAAKNSEMTGSHLRVVGNGSPDPHQCTLENP